MNITDQPAPLADADENFENAHRGFIATIPDAHIVDAKGRVAWSLRDYQFLEEDVPASTVHPNLWQHARLNNVHGLFKVTERIYQVRGFDVSNVSFIEGDNGVIVIDPLTVSETAEAALKLYRAHRGDRPVTGLIYTHSHADHFGGARGVIDEADAIARRVPIVAPQGFMWHTVSENILAGNAMGRRAMFQFGVSLPRNACGQVDCGMGKAVPMGTTTLIPPTRTIERETETHTIDGVEIIFHLALESEAPSEMFMHFPGCARSTRPRSAPRPCTTCAPCAAPRCAMPGCGRATSTRRWNTTRQRPTWCSRSTTGRPGATRRFAITSATSATCTSTCTTRRCA